MGRKMKVYASEVSDYLEQNGSNTIFDLSKYFGCTKATIRKRIRELRESGTVIIHNKEGIRIIDTVDKNNANDVLKMGNWIIGEVVGFAKIGKTMKKPMIQVRKILQLTKEERAALKKSLLQLTHLIDDIELDNGLSETKKNEKVS